MNFFEQAALAADSTAKAVEADPLWAAILATLVALAQIITHYLAHQSGVSKGKKQGNGDDP